MNPKNDRLDELLRRWERLRKQGQQVTAAELAKDDPDLLPELQRQIDALEGLGRFLQVRARRAEVSDASMSDDLRDLLHRRLMAIIILCLAYALADWGFVYWSSASRLPPLLVDYLVPCLALSALLVFLGRRHGLSLRALRSIELVLFGLITLSLSGADYDWLLSPWVTEAASTGSAQKTSMLIGDSVGIPWFVAIVLYGTCIPNSGRRCAAVVACMAAVALASILFVSARHDLADRLQGGMIFAKTAFWVAVGVTIAVWGSRRLSAMRREVIEARRLGQYLLRRFLGSGGMGEVFLAEHQLLRRLCAIKIIRPERFGDPHSFQRFEREVKATASLTHGSIVEVFDYGHTDEGLFYYVMEYLPGMNLQDMLDEFGPVPAERAVHFLRQICWGLREAHASGLIHRDIKPSNILICERGRIHDVVKLVDFGLVKEADSGSNPSLLDISVGPATPVEDPALQITQAGLVVGTPRYMAPEQIRGHIPLDGRCDIYSLGMVAYVMLTGEYPFHCASFHEMAEAHLKQPVPPLSDVGADLNAVVMRCLEKDRNDRFPDAESLEAALAQCSAANRWTIHDAARWWREHVIEKTDD